MKWAAAEGNYLAMNQKLVSWSLFSGLTLAIAVGSRAQEEIGTSAGAQQWKGIARLKTLSSNGKVAGKEYHLRGQYPVFAVKTPLTQYANAQLKRYANKNFEQFRTEAKKEMKESGGLGYEYDSGPSLSWYKPSRIVSLNMNTYRFMGGAHGLGLSDGITYAMINGKPKEIGLKDCFLTGTDYRTPVERAIFVKLRKDERAAWVEDGSVKSLTVAQFNNFVVEKDGLRWTFNPYEMGPYAVGQIEVKLTAKELGPGVNKKVLWG